MGMDLGAVALGLLVLLADTFLRSLVLQACVVLGLGVRARGV